MNTYRVTVEVDIEADNVDEARAELRRWLDTSADFEWLANNARVKRKAAKR